MSKVSSKRQISLSIEQCRELGLEPGDEVECFIADGQLTIFKKVAGAARGILRQVRTDDIVTDEESRQNSIETLARVYIWS